MKSKFEIRALQCSVMSPVFSLFGCDHGDQRECLLYKTTLCLPIMLVQGFYKVCTVKQKTDLHKAYHIYTIFDTLFVISGNSAFNSGASSRNQC